MKGRKHADRLRATYSRKGGYGTSWPPTTWKPDVVFGQLHAQKTWREWLTFLKWLRRRYRSGEHCTWFWTISGRI